MTVSFRKEPTDVTWANDPGVQEYLAFMKKFMPDANPTETYSLFGYATAQTFVHVLQNCGDNLTRENLMRQATSIKDLVLPHHASRHQAEHNGDTVYANEPSSAG